MPKANGIKFLGLLLLFAGGCALSLFYGGSRSAEIDTSDFIFRDIRIPKTITAILAGATLSAAGLVLQIIFRNPLAGPYVLGISSGASLMVAITILAGTSAGFITHYVMGRSIIMLASVLGSFAVTLLILFLSSRVRSNVVLLLIGLMLSQICAALQGALEFFADPNELKNFVIWGMGSLSNTTNADMLLYIPLAFFFLFMLLFFIKPLNAFLLGENYAQSSGVNYAQNRFRLILISSVLTGVTTAFCGPIAFVGIAVPLLSRMIFNTSRQEIHLFSCMLIGACILLFADFFCFAFASTLPVNMITTFVGAPLVIYLLFKNRQW